MADEPKGDIPADEPKNKKGPPETKTPPEDSDTGGKDIGCVLASLQKLGVTLPDDTTFENLGDRLIGAAAMKTGPEETPVDNTPKPVPDANAIAMSLEKRAQALEARVVAGEKTSLKQRIGALLATGRITKVIADKLTADLGTVRLSLADDGSVSQTTLAAKVEAYEALPASSAFPADRLSHAREVLPPAGEPNHSPRTEAEVNAVVAQWDASMGRK